MAAVRWVERLQVACVADTVAVRIGLVGVEHRRAVVEDIRNLVPVLILQGVDHEVGLAAAGRAVRAVGVGAADSVLATAGAAVAERPRRAVGRGRARRPEVFHAVAGAGKHGRPAVALDEWPHEPVEVLTARIADRRHPAVRGAPTRALHFVAGALPRHIWSRLTELPGGARARHRRITGGAKVEDAAAGGHETRAAR